MACITKKLLPALLIMLSVTTEAFASCGRLNVIITQGKTGEVVEGQPEWSVVVKNTCACTLSHIKLTCFGFSSVKGIDPTLFRSIADEQDQCLVNGGRPIAPFATVRFKYAWLTPYDLPFLSAKAHCTLVK